MGRRERQRNAALRDLSRTAEALQSDLDRELRITGVALDVLATAPSLDAALAGDPGGPGAEPFWARSRALIDRRPAVLHSIALFDLQGRPRLNTLAPPGTAAARLRPVALSRHAAAADRPRHLFRHLMRAPDGYVSPLFLGPLAGQPVIAITMVVRRDDRAVGLLAANILPRSLGGVLRGEHLRPGWIATLVDSRGLVIARTERENDFFARPAIGWMSDFQRSTAAAATIKAVPATAPRPMRRCGACRPAIGPCRSASRAPSSTGRCARRCWPPPPAGRWPWARRAVRHGARRPAGRGGGGARPDAAMVARDQPPPARAPPRVREVARVRQALDEAGAALRARAAAKREAEEHLVLLLREVDHRAKNALAVALSLIRLAPRDVPPDEFAATAEGRITAMARAHALLARGAWTGAELMALAESELPAHAGQVRLAGPPARLSAEAVQPVAMLLHELATNAAKHGALSVPGGEVRIAWEFLPADRALRLTWTERGGPPVAGAPARRSFGLRLMTQLAERQLAGRLGFDWAPQGLCATLTLPAARAAPDGTRCRRRSPRPGRPPSPPAPPGPPRVARRPACWWWRTRRCWRSSWRPGCESWAARWSARPATWPRRGGWPRPSRACRPRCWTSTSAPASWSSRWRMH